MVRESAQQEVGDEAHCSSGHDRGRSGRRVKQVVFTVLSCQLSHNYGVAEGECASAYTFQAVVKSQQSYGHAPRAGRLFFREKNVGESCQVSGEKTQVAPSCHVLLIMFRKWVLSVQPGS